MEKLVVTNGINYHTQEKDLKEFTLSDDFKEIKYSSLKGISSYFLSNKTFFGKYFSKC